MREFRSQTQNEKSKPARAVAFRPPGATLVLMLILGIDPGLRLTGYALVSLTATSGGRPQLQEAGVLRMKSKGDLATRLFELHTHLAELIAETSPDRVAVEQLYAHYKHPRTAILMGHARGVILLAASQKQLPVTNLASTMVKRTVTGNGHASKGQVQRAVATLCKLPKPPEPPDVADAIAIAWTLAMRIGSKSPSL